MGTSERGFPIVFHIRFNLYTHLSVCLYVCLPRQGNVKHKPHAIKVSVALSACSNSSSNSNSSSSKSSSSGSNITSHMQPGTTVNGGSLAEQAGLMPGDSVVKINDVDVFNLRHKEAQDVVVRSGNNFVMTVQRGGSTWRPQITPTGQLPQPNSPYLQTVTKTSLAHKQLESQHVGCGYNNAAKPFTQGVDGSVKSIVNKQYNSPVGIYSDESIAETLSAQAEVLAGGVLG
uniref:PDZ domain-containing protein n=1 Tax=Glossina palpalis gambiensis TaxID=67801 RepID=A0A1B0BE83_9MUSC